MFVKYVASRCSIHNKNEIHTTFGMIHTTKWYIVQSFLVYVIAEQSCLYGRCIAYLADIAQKLFFKRIRKKRTERRKKG